MCRASPAIALDGEPDSRPWQLAELLVTEQTTPTSAGSRSRAGVGRFIHKPRSVVPVGDTFSVHPRYWDSAMFGRQEWARGRPAIRQRTSDCSSDGTAVDAESNGPIGGVGGPGGE